MRVKKITLKINGVEGNFYSTDKESEIFNLSDFIKKNFRDHDEFYSEFVEGWKDLTTAERSFLGWHPDDDNFENCTGFLKAIAENFSITKEVIETRNLTSSEFLDEVVKAYKK